jgi:hypothetical protein
MRDTRIHAAPDGGSRFEDVEVAMSEDVLAGNVPRMGRSSSIRVTTVLFVEHLLGAEQSWELRRAPRRQLVIRPRGRFRVEASGGSSREFGPGDVVLARIPSAPVTGRFRSPVTSGPWRSRPASDRRGQVTAAAESAR